MKRKIELEQYYTDRELAKECINFLTKRRDISSKYIVEPCAGTGAFSDNFDEIVKIDLDPKKDDIVKADFFECDFPKLSVFIGNPPYGARGSLAMKFINRSCEFADIVAFILPRSFKKYTFINRIDPYFHLVDQFNCEDFVDINGNVKKVKSVFQIWERRNYTRVREDMKKSHPDFKSKHVHMSRINDEEFENLRNEYEFGIPQVGANFKPILIEDIQKKGSWWLFKPNNGEVFEKFQTMEFNFLDDMNTSFKSLSIKDIIKAYEQ
jgi:predicted RNA methylase